MGKPLEGYMLVEPKHEMERLKRIIHAAAEQSKNFAFPTITDAKPLEEILITLGPTTPRFYFDPDGQSLFPIFQELKDKNAQEIVLMIGPEADLTTEEKKLVQKHNFIFCRLTPTILRAQQAAAVSLGAFRSLLTS